MAAANSIITAFALLTFTWAYLSVNTPDKHAELQIGNYLLTYITATFTGFLAYAFTATGETGAKVLSGWNQSFYFVLILVAAVFLIKILNAVLEATGKEVL